MIPADLEMFERVAVTGQVLSEDGLRVENLQATVGTLDSDGRIKFWPVDSDDPQLPPDCNGKLWFDRETVEVVRVS